MRQRSRLNPARTSAEHQGQVQRILQEPAVNIAVAVAVPLVLPGHQACRFGRPPRQGIRGGSLIPGV